MNRTNEVLAALLESEEDDFDIKDVADKAKSTKLLPLGTIIQATMLEEDVIPALLDELESVAPQEAAEVRENYSEEIAANDPDFCWTTLFDILQEHAPPYTYVGAHPGDGSDYGVWVSTEKIDEDLEDGDTDKLQSFVRGQRMPKGSKYVVMIDASGDYIALFDGVSGNEIWSV